MSIPLIVQSTDCSVWRSPTRRYLSSNDRSSFATLLRPVLGSDPGRFLEGAAYVGYEFGCAWEEEHGLGLMMHQGRIVAMGGADTAILEWIAEKDAQKRAEKVTSHAKEKVRGRDTMRAH